MKRRSHESLAEQRRAWTQAKKAEVQFGRTLRGLAQRIGGLTRQVFDPSNPVQSSQKIRKLLEDYATTLQPWAEAVSVRMVNEVGNRDVKMWFARSKEMNRALHEEIKGARTGELFRDAVRETAKLIKSIPRDAAVRVGQLSVKALLAGQRIEPIVKEIMKTGTVAKSHAMSIARTQVSTTATALIKVRAEHIGSEGYIWRTVGDINVRDQHRKLNGKFIKWSDPPIAGNKGERAHAGQIYNCRCWAEVVIPNEFYAEAA